MILLTSIGEFLKRMTKIDQNEISAVFGIKTSHFIFEP